MGRGKKYAVQTLLLVLIGVYSQTCHVSERPAFRSFSTFDCSRCKYIIKETDETIDGSLLKILPGDYICFSSRIKHFASLLLTNIIGKPNQPVIITNCDGPVQRAVQATEPFNLKFGKSKYFRVTGNSWELGYGLKLSGGTIGLTLDNLSTDFEIDNIEIFDAGFAGIMAKTDPSCDSATIRGQFVLRNAEFHDNFVHDVGGEGFYVGNSFYVSGVSLPCGIRFPHELENIRIHHNQVKNTGRESIQLGCATSGAEIYSNTVEAYGLMNISEQTNGIQIGEGTGGLCFSNKIMSGTGTGIIVLGLGDNIVFNNLIIKSGSDGIFCDNRYTPKNGFKFINNTIVNPQGDGIRIYADSSYLMNIVLNNIIVNPATYWDYQLGGMPNRNGFDAYLFLKDTSVHVYQSNNFFTQEINDVGFVDAHRMNFSLHKTSRAVYAGKDVSNYGIQFDFCNHYRPVSKNYDCGAFEYDSSFSVLGSYPCGVEPHPRTR
ncbi:MAG TPA: right-handed parallel beta-helix repeat-containing protein [Cyclobacteriaceae bacterium]|nr:right-handed parallel beta-helix repeat-containing protein [Cyclobacteriaceae bacterium]